MSPVDAAGSMRSEISESAGPIDELIQRLTPPPLSPASSSSARGRTTPSVSRPVLHASPGRPLSDHHHVVQTRRSSYGVSSSDSHNGSPSPPAAAPPVLPKVRIIRPSLPPGSSTQEDSRDSFEVRPVDTAGITISRAISSPTASPSGSPSRTGKQQKQRRNVVGPSGILSGSTLKLRWFQRLELTYNRQNQIESVYSRRSVRASSPCDATKGQARQCYPITCRLAEPIARSNQKPENDLLAACTTRARHDSSPSVPLRLLFGPGDISLACSKHA